MNIDDIISLNERFENHKGKSVELKTRVEILNKKKELIINKFERLESQNFAFPSVFEKLNDDLLSISEKRAQLYNEWLDLNKLADIFYEKSKIFEMKKLASDLPFSNSDRIKIEMMLVEWDIILKRQENKIRERESAINTEENIISEVERQLSLL